MAYAKIFQCCEGYTASYPDHPGPPDNNIWRALGRCTDLLHHSLGIGDAGDDIASWFVLSDRQHIDGSD